MKPARKPQLQSEQLRSRLKVKQIASRNLLVERHPHVVRLLTSGVLAGSLMLSSGPLSTVAALPSTSENRTVSAPDELRRQIADQLSRQLPSPPGPLSFGQETALSDLFHRTWGIHSMAELEGNRLNTAYGLIGAEQHLPRYPGDTAAAHGGQFINSGITPGRGAWGYFAPSRQQLTADLVEKERYYVAVQTLYLPDWTIRLSYLRDWYKYRKVLVVNPQNGKAVVAVVGDAGPASWTGKHFGGSPEIMAYLGLNVGKQKGPVVLFFVDDPGDNIPLGPLEYNLEQPLLLPG